MVYYPVLISAAVDQSGHRKILGVDFAFEESYQSYLNHFNKIKNRGLKYVSLIVSGDHKKLIKAQQELFPHNPHQCCIYHFMRNVLPSVPYL